jgi:hypothetical protein
VSVSRDTTESCSTSLAMSLEVEGVIVVAESRSTIDRARMHHQDGHVVSHQVGCQLDAASSRKGKDLSRCLNLMRLDAMTIFWYVCM